MNGTVIWHAPLKSNAHSKGWEACPVATTQCTLNECANGCNVACSYEEAFPPKLPEYGWDGIADVFSWENAITSNVELTKRQMAILRHPQSHAADPLAAATLIQRGLLKAVKRFIWFGQDVVVLTAKGLEEQKNLPPECYRSDPGPQQYAENDCWDCPHRAGCGGAF